MTTLLIIYLWCCKKADVSSVDTYTMNFIHLWSLIIFKLYEFRLSVTTLYQITSHIKRQHMYHVSGKYTELRRRFLEEFSPLDIMGFVCKHYCFHYSCLNIYVVNVI